MGATATLIVAVEIVLAPLVSEYLQMARPENPAIGLNKIDPLLVATQVPLVFGA